MPEDPTPTPCCSDPEAHAAEPPAGFAWRPVLELDAFSDDGRRVVGPIDFAARPGPYPCLGEGEYPQPRSTPVHARVCTVGHPNHWAGLPVLEALVPEEWPPISPALASYHLAWEDPDGPTPRATFSAVTLGGFGPAPAAQAVVREGWAHWRPRTPGEAVMLGKCPSCLGEGQVLSVVVPGYEGREAPTLCPTCGGSGKFPPPGSEDETPAP